VWVCLLLLLTDDWEAQISDFSCLNRHPSHAEADNDLSKAHSETRARVSLIEALHHPSNLNGDDDESAIVQ